MKHSRPLLWPLTTALLLAISGCGNATPPANDKASTDKTAAVSAPASSSASAGDAPESVRQAIIKHLKDAELTDHHLLAISSTEMPNLYWVTFEDVPGVYMSGDGQYLLQGDLVKLGKGHVTNLSDALNAKEAKRLITGIPDKDMIIFSPEGKPKAVVYAFTDVDCGYCRKLHSEIHDINARGIEVRYIAWPRSPQDVAINKAVWCSEDRKAALTTAKQGLTVQAPACNDPVMEQRKIGMQIGVNGTPALYNADGKYLGGYLPAAELAKLLNVS